MNSPAGIGFSEVALPRPGHAHLRRVVGEAAWAYQRRPWVGGFLLKRQPGLEQEVKEMAWKAQQQHSRYRKLSARGKNKNQVVTAVGRELLGFIWAIATRTESTFQRKAAQRPCLPFPPSPFFGIAATRRRCTNASWEEGMAGCVSSGGSSAGGS